MLEHLHLEHFKTWHAADVAFRPITGLFGTNSSGKSSLIQFLLLLKQTRDATDRKLALHFGDERTRTRLGGFEDLIEGGDAKLPLSWCLRWSREEPLKLSLLGQTKDAAISGASIALSAAVAMDAEEEVQQTRLEYQMGDARFALRPDDKGGFDALTVTGAGKFQLKRNPGRPPGFGAPTKGYLFPDAARLGYQNAAFLAELEAAYEAQMDQIFYLGPLREHPKREYAWSGSSPADVGNKGELAVEAILSAGKRYMRMSLPTRTNTVPFESGVAAWLRQLGLISSFSAKPIAKGSGVYRALVKTASGGPEVPLTDVGFGISQVLPVVVLLNYVPEGSTVILEQPEIHLHPLAQAELADLLIHVATQRRVQVLVESHSEHLLLRLQRRIAEEKVAADDVGLFFCDRDSKTGLSTIVPLAVDTYGQVTNWPRNFMGDAFGEAAKAELARLQRMGAAAE